MSTSDPNELLGRAETHNLEFKSAEVLKKPVTVAREVVAFLNAEGGEVWIGVNESEGRAISLEPIQTPDAARAALRDHLLDVIEPSPTNDEVHVDLVGSIIRVAVANVSKSTGRRPYALRKDKGRQYLLRIDSRIREMTRDQIAGEFKGASVVEDALAKVSAAIDQEQKSAPGRFWWQLVPNPPLKIDLEHGGPDTKKFFEDLLTNPQSSGNRRTGWSMVFLHDALPKVGPTRVVHTFGSGKNQNLVEIRFDGTMTFAIPRARLDRKWDGEGREIYPLALLEFPVSAFRIASKVMARFAPESGAGGKVVCGAVISGVAGTILRPGSPNMPSLPWKQPRKIEQPEIVVEPFEIEANQITKAPDAAAYSLVGRVYEKVGFDDTDIPPEFELIDGVRVLRFGR